MKIKFNGKTYEVTRITGQQEVDLEKEIDRFYGMYRKDGKTFDLTDNEQCVDWKMNCNSDFKIEFARHFYELGKNNK